MRQSILRNSLIRVFVRRYSSQENEAKTFQGLKVEFPCLTKNPDSGPEPVYVKIASGQNIFEHKEPFHFKLNNGVIPEMKIAYETWGELNEDRSNAVMLFTGLSASSHAKSHKNNPDTGWWEKFVGAGLSLDTRLHYVICANYIGGCYGSTGPMSLNPNTGKAYGTTFPMVTVEDLVKASFLLLDHLNIDKVHSIGSSLGGMTSLMAAAMYPDRVKRLVSISGCAQANPASIALHYLQRRSIMNDRNWNHGHYYGNAYPRDGMKLAREMGTLSYRSGPEWELRFGRRLTNPEEPITLCPSFVIENYIDYQGEQACVKYDPNSLLYISKAMDLFDMSDGYSSLEEGLSRIKCPTMVLGVQSDVLFPINLQRKLADTLVASGNTTVTFYELNSIFGHDTFLLDLNGVGSAVKGFLETELAPVHFETGSDKTDDTYM